MMNRNQANLDGYADRGQSRKQAQSDHAATRERDPQRAAEPRYGGATSVPATKRQLDFLETLIDAVPKYLTKQEASQLISELTGRP